MRSQERCNFVVYIVESPSHDDFFDDDAEAEMLYKGLQLLGIPARRRICTTGKHFHRALEEDLAHLTTAHPERYPILHISAHADAKSFALTNGEEIDWRDLRRVLRPLNKASDGRLIVCLSMCEGFAALEMAETNGASPFYALVGHSAEPDWADTAVGFLAFYRRRAAGCTIEKAVAAMRVASGNKYFKWCLGDNVKGNYLDAP